MYKKITAVLFFCSCLYSFSSEQVTPLFSTYLGEQLTSETLPLLAPQLPVQDMKAIRAWMNIPLHKRTIKSLTKLQWPLAGITGNFANQQKGINQLLAFQGTPNMSIWNYILTPIR
jgi:hypothetical protein